MPKPRKQIRRIRTVPTNCPFCHTDTQPQYVEADTLVKFMTERGKILARGRTGVCSKHQRALTRAVKRARHVALLPFVVRA